MNRMEPLGNTIQKQMEGLQQDLKAMSTGNSRIVDEIQGEMETLRQALIDLEATDGQESARERAAETQRTADGMLIDRMKDEVDQLWRKLNESTTLLEHDQRCLGRTVEQLAGSRAVWEYNSSAT
jgi:hypothetical protein